MSMETLTREEARNVIDKANSLLNSIYWNQSDGPRKRAQKIREMEECRCLIKRLGTQTHLEITIIEYGQHNEFRLIPTFEEKVAQAQDGLPFEFRYMMSDVADSRKDIITHLESLKWDVENALRDVQEGKDLTRLSFHNVVNHAASLQDRIVEAGTKEKLAKRLWRYAKYLVNQEYRKTVE